MYIQIQDGISVNIDLIEAVKKSTNNTCEVYVGGIKYKSTYPYETFMSMLNSKEEQAASTQRKLKEQFWSG